MLIRSTAKTQRYLYSIPVEMQNGEAGYSLSFSEDNNVTINVHDAMDLCRNLIDSLGLGALPFVKLLKKRFGPASLGPPKKGVGLSTMKCLYQDDESTTLSFATLDGVLIDTAICHNAEEREAFREKARQYA